MMLFAWGPGLARCGRVPSNAIRVEHTTRNDQPLAGFDPSIESDSSNVFGKHQANTQIGQKSTKRTKVAPTSGGGLGAALDVEGRAHPRRVNSRRAGLARLN